MLAVIAQDDGTTASNYSNFKRFVYSVRFGG